jgi:anti-sigma B factor antagonist
MSGRINLLRRWPLYSVSIPSERSTTPMELEVEGSERDAIIKLSGRLDMYTSPALRKAALAFCTRRGCKNLTIDLSEISFIDTSGLATLLEILVETREQNVQLTLAGLNGMARYLLDVNGLTGFFRIESSERERPRL